METDIEAVHVPAAELPADGETAVIQIGDEEVLLARVGDEYFAVNNLCSHAEGWLDMGALLPASCEVQCPLHDGKFDLRTGAPTHEPATEPVATYPVTVSDGEIYVGGRT